MIRTIAANSIRWTAQLTKCLTPSISKTTAFTRTFFAETQSQKPFIQNNAPPPNLQAVALKSAVDTANLKKVQALLQDGAKANQAFDDGSFILHHAAESNHSGIVSSLIKAGAQINIKTLQEGNTPLHRACALDHKLVVEELLRNKAKLNERNQTGNTPLEEAILAQSSDCCTLLYDAGANINEQNPTSGCSPLMTACKIGAYNIVKLLLLLGADPHLNTASLEMTLKYPDILQLLLKPQKPLS